MAMYENKWKKLQIAQRICMLLSILSWILVILPFLMDYTGVAAVLFFVENQWFVPLVFLFALGFTAADFLLGYRVYLHEQEERNPIVHRKKRPK